MHSKVVCVGKDAIGQQLSSTGRASWQRTTADVGTHHEQQVVGNLA